MAKQNFVHLHVHSEYSLLDGLAKPRELVLQAKKQNMKALALTDHGVMYGAIEFYKACLAENIKPIIGAELYLSATSRLDKVAQDSYHLTVLSKDFTGYQNLMKLVTEAYLTGFYYRPRIDFSLLQKYSEGLIVTSGCPAGIIPKNILNGQTKTAEKWLKKFSDLFTDNFYLELQRHRYSDFASNFKSGSKEYNDLTKMAANETKLEKSLLQYSRAYGIPLLATNDVHYLKPTDSTAQDAVVCVATGKVLADTNRMSMVSSPSYHLATTQEMYQLFADQKSALENTVKLADQVDIKITLGQWFFPKFKLKPKYSPEQQLCEEANAGLKRVYKKPSKIQQKRLDYELDIIIKKGYAEYFLIYADIVAYCQTHNILTNTRGSAAGSLVSYVMGITTVDPLEFELPFERFLNPYRPSPPDIDLDVADVSRDQVIKYLTDKYGVDKLAQICTFGRMMARQAVRDIGRVMGLSFSATDRIAKHIPLGIQGHPMTIKKAIELSPELKKMYEGEPETKKVIDMAQQVEGVARHISVHAAGVVIAPTELTKFSPLQRESRGNRIITQYEMHSCEDVGLIKLDLLGIRNLSIVQKSIEIVEKTRGEKINILNIDTNDPVTYKHLAKGETIGLFQLGGSGMTRYLKELKPTSLHDLSALVALFRPGPMHSIPEYIKRKNNPKLVKYFDPRMKDILKNSYGVITYQDDVLLIAIRLAGYDWKEVDKFRKAIGKKIPAEMAKQKIKFIEGCVKNGMSRKKAVDLFKLIEPFTGYGFNKAHAASYGKVAFQTAYMKAHYPVEYMAAVLSAESSNSDKMTPVIAECKKMGIEILPPDINESEVNFSVAKTKKNGDQAAIRFGLSGIKNVGDAAISTILKARKSRPFTSVLDFCQRVDTQKVNKRVLESLIKAGAFGQFGSRKGLLSVIDAIRSSGQKHQTSSATGQSSLFGDEIDIIPAFADSIPDEEFSQKELAVMEKELIGFYLSGHPLEGSLEKINQLTTYKINTLLDEKAKLLKSVVTIGGALTRIKKIVTKSSQAEMAFGTLEDDTGTIDIVVFPKVFAASRDVWQKDQLVIVTGRLKSEAKTNTLIVIEGHLLDELTPPDPNSFVVSLDLSKLNDKMGGLKEVKSYLKKRPGRDRLVIEAKFNGASRVITVPFTINYTKLLEKKLQAILDKRDD